MKTRIKMMVSSAMVGFGLAVLVLPLCLSGMRMLAATNWEKCSGLCFKSGKYCENSTCEAAGSTCFCDSNNGCICRKN